MDNRKLVRRSDLMTADMQGDTVMMDIVTGQYYNLGAVGGRIWELLETPMTGEQLIAQLTDEYDVDAAQCRADVVPFIDKLLAQGLLLAENP